jgi:hypothetical protein
MRLAVRPTGAMARWRSAVAERHPKATVIIPPRSTSVSGETTTTQRDRHLAEICKNEIMGWQRRSGYNHRSLVQPRCLATKLS